MTDHLAEQLTADLNRANIVRENLAARYGVLLSENIELLVRIHELEERLREQEDDHGE